MASAATSPAAAPTTKSVAAADVRVMGKPPNLIDPYLARGDALNFAPWDPMASARTAQALPKPPDPANKVNHLPVVNPHFEYRAQRFTIPPSHHFAFQVAQPHGSAGIFAR
jgi:hypothetical protein